MLQQKVSISKKLLSAEEVAKELNIKKFLIHLWTKEFKLTIEHAGSGNRCYSQNNVKIFAAIKDLVHNKKMTISQARRQIQALQDEAAEAPSIIEQDSSRVQPAVAVVDSVREEAESAVNSYSCEEGDQKEKFMQNMQIFKEQLLSFKQRLDLD